MERLEEHGPALDRPHVGFLRDHIHELRVRTHHGLYRLLFFFYGGRKFIITHGIVKKTAKVPDSEIDRAIKYRKDYIVRQERE
jgi:phage-related protein